MQKKSSGKVPELFAYTISRAGVSLLDYLHGGKARMDAITTRDVFSNPYIVQIDKFAESLKHLTQTFLCMEEYRGIFTEEEIEEMFLAVSEKVCEKCGNAAWCLKENRVYTRQLLYEILCTVEEYGAELNVEERRRIEKRCDKAPDFLKASLEVFWEAKQKLLWNNRIVQNREGCAASLVSFADMIRSAARELGTGIFLDERLEKKVKHHLARHGIKVLNTVFYLHKNGKHEIHLTLKTSKGQCIMTKEIGQILSGCVGWKLIPEAGERPVIGEEYCTIVLRERVCFYTLQGVAKIGKGCEQISGDTFSMTKLSGGKEGIVLSDGMGTGPRAFKESAMVVEMLEELLEAGFSPKTAIQMLNTALVISREEVMFSTVDMCIFDLYEGSCEFLKAGASTTFLRHEAQVERLTSSSLPVGVLPDLELDCMKRDIANGDLFVFVTDGVMDAFPVKEQEALLGALIQGAKSENPKEIAHYILEQVLEWGGEPPMDDMTVMVVSVWEL